ncbi:MAG: gamma carbonic anhydrase family protein [Thermoanaerobaculia bacterium]|nr:gamma carbonic anhydrase family protein [Thermoanaerobaculia bacterium]
MPALPFRDQSPRCGERVWLAPSAVVTGNVTLGDDVSFWFHTVARGDVHWIRIGDATNVQDGSVLHVSHGTHPLEVGRGVVIGHSAVIHGCTIRDGALIGIGARVLDGAVIGEQAQVAAGAVVPPGMEVPPATLAMGIPARVRRELSDEERVNIAAIRDRYVSLKEEYRRVSGDGF